MYKIVYTDDFSIDYIAVMAYISDVWSGNSVTNFAYELYHKIERLKESPVHYVRYHVNERYRFFGHWNYLVLYTVNEQSKQVYINRIIHSSRNIADML